jgi:predicted ATPase
MISSRDIKDLHPKVQAKVSELLARCRKEGLDVLIYSTYRDIESQN